jgi:hypothetical protein
LFLDHRVSISGLAVGPTIPRGDWNRFDSVYGPLLNGTAKTKLKGAKLTALQYPNFAKIEPEDLKDWNQHGHQKGWWPVVFDYVCDEPPSGCTWAQLGQKASSFRSLAPGMPNLVTASIADATKEGVLDQLDILAVNVNFLFSRERGNLRSQYNTWLAQPGKQLWWYQSCNSHESCYNEKPGLKEATWASYMIDASPVRNRIFQWQAYLDQIQGELYYQTDLWKQNEDPWDHLYDFGGNGDGALFYPGTTDKIGGTRPIPVASMRLKFIRDGMEDYEYLNALKQQGHAETAERISRTFVQNVITFNNDPQALTAAREQLGAELHALARHAKR